MNRFVDLERCAAIFVFSGYEKSDEDDADKEASEDRRTCVRLLTLHRRLNGNVGHVSVRLNRGEGVPLCT